MKSAAPAPPRIGLALCTCGRRLFPRSEWDDRLKALGSKLRLLRSDNLCDPAEQAKLARAVKSAGIDRLVLAGCPPVGREDVRLAVARQAGLAPSAVYPAWLPPAAGRTRSTGGGQRKAHVEAALRAIRRAVAAVGQMPSFSLQSLPLCRRAAVIGAGPAGLLAAAALRELGLPTTVVEQRGAATSAPAVPAPAVPAPAVPAPASLRGAQILSGTRLVGLAGRVGAFTLHLAGPEGGRTLQAGALVVAAGVPSPEADPFTLPGVVPLEQLPSAAAALPRRREGRELAIVLDCDLEEGKASTECALRLALELQGQPGNRVHLLCREVRVASLPLERLYGQVREAGVDVARHDGAVTISRGRPDPDGELAIRYTDALLGTPALLSCDLAGLSRYGLRVAADAALAAALGLSTDGLGQLQDNNLHLSPAATNRPGIFVLGSCRGQPYLPQIQAEARAAALAVHQLLCPPSPGALQVELSSPIVDADKCVLCLTCVRACPYKAMVVDGEAKAAKSLPEACQRCGICAGECPARAITLPAWSDAVLLSQIEGTGP